MTNRQKAMDLTSEVSLVQETYSTPAYELFRFETSGLVLRSGDPPGDVGDNTGDGGNTDGNDWS